MSGAAPARLRTRILTISSSADSPVMSLRRHVDGGGASRKALQLARLVGTDREPVRSDPYTAGTRRRLLVAGQRPAGAAPDHRGQPEDPRPARCAAQDEHLLLWRGRAGPRVHIAGYSCAPGASTRCVPSVAYPSEYSTYIRPRNQPLSRVPLWAPTRHGHLRDEPALHQDRGARPGWWPGGTAWVCAPRNRHRGRACSYLWGAPGSRSTYVKRCVRRVNC